MTPTVTTAPRISLLLNWYSEDSFIREMWESVRALVDEVVVVAGPYAFARDPLDLLEASITSADARAKAAAIFGNVPLVYVDDVWPTEYEKRVAGYEACSGDLILIVDADEIIEFDDEALRAFIASDYCVARINVVNIASSEAVFVADDIDYVSRFPAKTILFRRDAISARRHIDYLWLVGVRQDTSELLPTFPDPMGTMLHLTGPRSPEDHLTRFVFYEALYWETHFPGRRHDLLERLERYAGCPDALRSSSPAAVGVDEERTYRGIPAIVTGTGPLWTSLADRARSFETARWSGLDPRSWPPGLEYFLFAQASTSAHAWTATVPTSWQPADFRAVLGDGRVARVRPSGWEQRGETLTFALPDVIAYFTPLVHIR